MDAICQIENSFNAPFRPTTTVTHQFSCIIRIHGNFLQKKNERHFVHRIFYEFWSSSLISMMCVCVCIRLIFYFFSSWMMSAADCVRSFWFRSRSTIRCTETKSHRSKNVRLLFWNDLWCLHGANMARIVLFICLRFMHTIDKELGWKKKTHVTNL